MPKMLTEEQVEAYHRDGFVHPIRVMSAGDAESFRLRLEDAERCYAESINGQNRNNTHVTLKCMDELVHHGAILDAVEDVIGPNILAWGTVLFIKAPDAKSFVSWHQDVTYMPLEPNDGVTPWLALTPSNRTTGCMQMIPGSHKQDIVTHEDHFGDDNILTRGQTIAQVDETQAVDLILDPGQISLHHGRTIHSSAPNFSGKRRVGVAMQQFLPPHVRERNGRGFAQLARGKDEHNHFDLIERPAADMTPESQRIRGEVNEHWSALLYVGADKKRAY